MRKTILTIMMLAVSMVGVQAQSDVRAKVPHIAQGQGCSTVLRFINVCDERVSGFEFGLFGGPYVVALRTTKGIGRLPGRHHVLRKSYMVPGQASSFILPDTEEELIQGFAWGGLHECVAMEVEYRQTLPGGEERFATIPIRQESFSIGSRDWGFSLTNKEGCQTGIAFHTRPMRSSAIEARAPDGDLLDRAEFGQTPGEAHAAFPLHEMLPAVEAEQARYAFRTIHVLDVQSVVALEFCGGKLEPIQAAPLGGTPGGSLKDDDRPFR